MHTKSGVVLEQDETLIMEVEAELYATSTNPIARIIGSVIKMINAILGSKKQGFLVVTDRRVLEVMTTKACYVFEVARGVKVVRPDSIKEVAYAKETTLLVFCPSYYLAYQGSTEFTKLHVHVNSDDEIMQLVNKFYRVIG